MFDTPSFEKQFKGFLRDSVNNLTSCHCSKSITAFGLSGDSANGYIEAYATEKSFDEIERASPCTYEISLASISVGESELMNALADSFEGDRRIQSVDGELHSIIEAGDSAYLIHFYQAMKVWLTDFFIEESSFVPPVLTILDAGPGYGDTWDTKSNAEQNAAEQPATAPQSKPK